MLVVLLIVMMKAERFCNEMLWNLIFSAFSIPFCTLCILRFCKSDMLPVIKIYTKWVLNNK